MTDVPRRLICPVAAVTVPAGRRSCVHPILRPWPGNIWNETNPSAHDDPVQLCETSYPAATCQCGLYFLNWE